jgi:PAS domain S-box-containing protein
MDHLEPRDAGWVTHPTPKVADFIEAHRDALVRRFAEEAARLPSARGLTHNELIDTLHEYLATLATISRQGHRGDPLSTKQRLEETHLSLRLRLGYTQFEVEQEYVLIGRLIAGLWETLPLTEQPTAEDIQLLLDELQDAMDYAGVVFTGYTQEARQHERHYLRRLDALSPEALGGGLNPIPLSGRLEPLLAVIQEALGTDSCALFLVEEDGKTLRLTASVGLGAEPPGSYVTQVDAPSFLGQVARANEPLHLSDAANASMEIRPAVRHSGLRSLLGVRLWPLGKLLGVLTVGLSHTQPFNPRTRRYVETLSEYLSGIIDRARLFERIQQNELRSRSLLESTEEAIWGMDAEGRCTFVNPACVRLLGYDDAGEVLGKPMHSLVHHSRPGGTPYPEEECPLYRAFQEERGTAGEDTFWRANGTPFPVRYRCSPVHQKGQSAGAVVVFEDISERRRVAEALERSEREFRTLAEAMPQIVWAARADGHMDYVNQRVTEYLGLAPGVAASLAWSGMLHPDDVPHTCERWRQAVEGGEPYEVEHRMRGADGTFRWFLSRATALRDEQGRVLRWLGTSTDIDALKRAEAERERLARVVEQSSNFIGIADPEGRALYVNEAGRRLLGLPDLDAVRRTRVIDYFIEEDKPFVEEVILPTQLREGAWEGEYRFRHFQTGEPVPVYYRQFLLKDPETGALIGVAAIARDISEELRRREAAARRSGFERQLIGIVSHDLRNPLNGILLSTQTLLRRRGLDERQATGITRIRDAAERMNRMIRDLLDFTQARLGRGLPMECAPLDLHELTRQVVDEVLLAYPDRRIEVVAEGDGHGSWDGDRLAQLLTNLLVNALSYSPPGTPVHVATRGKEDGVVLEVHNEGAPIPTEQLGRLFQPMERGEIKHDRAGRSIGLGLFIVDSIVRAHGGTIQVRSTAEEGTTFRVWLPRQPPAASS